MRKELMIVLKKIKKIKKKQQKTKNKKRLILKTQQRFKS